MRAPVHACPVDEAASRSDRWPIGANQRRTGCQLRAPGVRWLSHLGHNLADLQPRARWKVVDRNVEVDDQLVSGKLLAVAGARNRRQHPAVHRESKVCDLARDLRWSERCDQIGEATRAMSGGTA
jgi:hypothetical protein